MKKILFLHGFYASGQCVPAMALRETLAGRAEVLTPDLPMHPKEALQAIRELIDREKPDLLVGNSCGSFYAQMLAPIVGIPALLGNPHFRMSEFLSQRIGEHEYKFPRKDGNQHFIIDEALVSEFEEIETVQFKYCNPYYRDRAGHAGTLRTTISGALQPFFPFPRRPYPNGRGSGYLVRAAHRKAAARIPAVHGDGQETDIIIRYENRTNHTRS